MIPNPLLADISPLITNVIGVGAVLFVLFVFAIIYASRYAKCGPNEVLVISGKKRTIIETDGSKREVGFRIVKGGGHLFGRGSGKHFAQQLVGMHGGTMLQTAAFGKPDGAAWRIINPPGYYK